MVFSKKRVPEKSPYIKVKSSGIHNKGVFAKKFIPKDTKIIEYGGKLITKKQSEKVYEKQLELSEKDSKKGSVYTFTLNKTYDLDGNFKWNKTRLINHSCSPNAESINLKGHIWIVAEKDIKKGEEITYDYGYDIDNYKSHPCKCGSENCVGYIVGEKYRKRLKKKLEKLKT